MNQTAAAEPAPVAWGIWMSAHAGHPIPGMRVHSLHEQPLCLRTASGALVPHRAAEADGTEHSVFGVGEDRRAWIQNACATLSCRVNGAEMRPGERWPLSDRDDITIGLTRLSVVQADSPLQWEAWDGCRPGDALDDQAALLALRALNDTDTHAVPFLPEDRRHSRRGAGPDGQPQDANDPLASLATEFDQAIQGTHQGLRALHSPAPGLPGSTLPPPPDPFEAPAAAPATRMLLEGLLPEATDIDSILADMNAFDESQLFAPPPAQDVLRLLADQAGASAPSRTIASLARREHHDLSIDSHFQQDLSESAQ